MPAACWTQIAALEGRALHTVARAKPFTVQSVTNAQVELLVHDGGRTRVLYRKDLEPFYAELVRTGSLAKREMGAVYTFNSSLAAALLAALPGVTTTVRPIVLHWRLG